MRRPLGAPRSHVRPSGICLSYREAWTPCASPAVAAVRMRRPANRVLLKVHVIECRVPKVMPMLARARTV